MKFWKWTGAVFGLSAAFVALLVAQREPAAAAAAAQSGSNYSVTTVADGGTLAGTIKLQGAAPKIEILPVTRNNDHCGRSKESEVLLVGPGGGVRNAAVLLQGVRRGKAFPTPSSAPQVDQKGCLYVPHVQIVPVGSKIDLVNSDPILHNVHGYLNGTRTVFNLAMPLENQRIQRTLGNPGIIRLQCDAGHTWMSAYIVVAESPYYALTDEQGRFEITGIPPGSYAVRFWHEKFGEKTQSVTVTAGGTARLDAEFSVP